MASQEEELWVLAQKWRHEVVKETDPLKEDGLDGSELARFEKVEGHLAQYRLACIQAILGDTKFAAEKGIELDLWQTHLLINSVYRKVLHRLSSGHQKSTKRKVDNLYQHFLKVAQEFYRGYLQRISARYGLKELGHALRRLRLSEMELPSESQVNASASGVKDEVIASCHQTLICLGDLARYRTFQRPTEKRNWASALTAYELATSLAPDSGFGHHQTGLIYLETRDYFKAVYYMYRAMGCSRPHELAGGNLNRAFKEVLKPDAFASKKGWTDTTAMTNWFVKLHGRFAKGEERKAYDEMEEEVLHRFSRSLKVASDADLHDALLKMVVTNIAAYSATVKKTIGHWSEAGSRSCEHLLRWNIRTIHSTARLLQEELADHLKNISSNPPKEDALQRTQSTISFGMALLSVYMTWLCTYSSDLVDFRPHLEPYFADMGKALAQTLTLTLDLVYRSLNSVNGASLPFRLAEDEETLGLRCLDGANLPDRCRLQYVSLTGKAKISKEDYDGEYSDEQMLITRAAHISCCAVQLGSDAKFPFLYSTIMEDSKPKSTVLFLEEGKPPSAAATQRDTTMLLQPSAASPPAEETILAVAHASEPPPSEPPMDDQVFSMVTEFLVPPESPRTAAFPQDTSSITQSSPLPPPRRASSTAPAQYPNLPWNFFYTPTPLPTPGQQCLPPSPGYGPVYTAAAYGIPPLSSHAAPTHAPAPEARQQDKSPMQPPYSPYWPNSEASDLLPLPRHMDDVLPRAQRSGDELPPDLAFRLGQAQRATSRDHPSGGRVVSSPQRTRTLESLNSPPHRALSRGPARAVSSLLNRRDVSERDERGDSSFNLAAQVESLPVRIRDQDPETRPVGNTARPPGFLEPVSTDAADGRLSSVPASVLSRHASENQRGKDANEVATQSPYLPGPGFSSSPSHFDLDRRREFLLNTLRRNIGGQERGNQAEQALPSANSRKRLQGEGRS